MDKLKNQTWRDRLSDALAEKGLSRRAISIAAGLGPGAIHSWLKDGKDPNLENIMAVCQAAGISLSFVTHGYYMSSETEELLRLLEAHPQSRDGILQILRSQADA